MEIEILNEIMTNTTSALFSECQYKPNSSKMLNSAFQFKPDSMLTSQERRESDYSINSNLQSIENNKNNKLEIKIYDQKKQNKKSTFQNQQSVQISSNEFKEITIDSWMTIEGPAKLEESLQKLQLDLNNVSKSDLEKMTFKELSEEKKKVKNELKSYDNCFKKHFDRFPQRNEKEPLRPLYIYYKKLKQYLSTKNQQQGNENQQNSYQEDKIFQKNFQNSKHLQAIQKLKDLKNERNLLREKLHSYQVEFTKANNRKIRYHKDIIPVQDDYKNYKEIKAEIIKLEKFLEEK